MSHDDQFIVDDSPIREVYFLDEFRTENYDAGSGRNAKHGFQG